MRLRLTLLALLCAPGLAGGQTLQEFSPARKDSSQLVVFASGNAKTVVAEPKEATSATGSLGMTFIGTSFIVTGVVNVPAKSDTVSSAYGASMLAPASGTRTSALLDIRLARPFAWAAAHTGVTRYLSHLGVHSYLAASGSTWGSEPDTNGQPGRVDDVSTWATGLGLSYVFFDGWIGTPHSDDGSRVGMSLDVMGAVRTIRGDLGMAADSLRREALLGTKGRAFGGAEFGLNIRYNEANAALTYYHLGGSIPGFSGGQVVAGISFRAKLNGGFFTKE